MDCLIQTTNDSLKCLNSIRVVVPPYRIKIHRLLVVYGWNNETVSGVVTRKPTEFLIHLHLFYSLPSLIIVNRTNMGDSPSKSLLLKILISVVIFDY